MLFVRLMHVVGLEFEPKLEEMSPPECRIVRDPELVNCKVPFQVEMPEPKGSGSKSDLLSEYVPLQ